MDQEERIIGRVLLGEAEQAIPSDVDLWPTVRQCLPARAIKGSGRRPRMPRRVTLVAFGTCLAIIIGAVGAAAASPAIHRALDALAGTFGIGVATNSQFQTTGGYTISPAPPFRYAELDAIPAGLTQHQFVYLPPQQPGPRGGERSVLISDGPPAPAAQSTLALLARSNAGAVWLHFASNPPGSNFLDIIEQPGVAPVVGGETIGSGSQAETIQQEGNQTTLTTARFGTVVSIRTDLGRDVALNVVNLLKWH